MKLFYTKISPYARKVRLVAQAVGLLEKIELIESDPREDLSLRTHNPLSKVPTLLLDDGTALYDSPVICEYLAFLAGDTTVFPPAGPKRWRALKLQALGDAIADSAVIMMMENRREPQLRLQSIYDRQTKAITASLAVANLELQPLRFDTVGEMAMASGLRYLQFRFPDFGWETDFPELSQWLTAFGENHPTLNG